MVANALSRYLTEDHPSTVGIGHVRYSTHGTNKLENAQPIVVACSKGEIALAHNGNISNSEELTAGFGPILALAPAANWLGKTWPLERFSRVAMRLLDPEGPMKGGRLMVLGGPEDAKLARELKDVVMRNQFINLTQDTDLLTAYACLKRARLFIGNDSGTMHLAAAAGIPTLGLFGPSDEQLYGPWGANTRVARGPRTYEQIRAVDPSFGQALCHMMDLSVETVSAAAEELLAATEETRKPAMAEAPDA